MRHILSFIARQAAAGVLIIACLAMVVPVMARAADYGLDDTANVAFGDATELQQPQDPAAVAGRVIATALSFLGIIMLGIVIYAGFLWMTAGGNQDKVSTAIKLVTNASIGLLVILAAYLLTRYLGTALMNVLS